MTVLIHNDRQAAAQARVTELTQEEITLRSCWSSAPPTERLVIQERLGTISKQLVSAYDELRRARCGAEPRRQPVTAYPQYRGRKAN
jgi:hypothetical protein